MATPAVPNSSYEVARDNLETLDKYINNTSGTVTNRDGRAMTPIPVLEQTMQDILDGATFIPVVGSFQAGGTLTLRNNILLNTADGNYYSWGGNLPKVVASGSTPATAGGLGISAWVLRADTSLRNELGSAAYVDIQTDQLDGTLGKAVRVGGFGLGSAAIHPAIDANDITTPGFWGSAISILANAPPSTVGRATYAFFGNTSYGVQLCWDTNDTGNRQMFFRLIRGSTWSTWVEVAHNESPFVEKRIGYEYKFDVPYSLSGTVVTNTLITGCKAPNLGLILIPANTFNSTGKKFRVRIWGNTVGTAGTKTIALRAADYLAGTNPATLASSSLGSGEVTFSVEFNIFAKDVSNQYQTLTEQVNGIPQEVAYNPRTVDFSVDRELRITGTLVDAADTINVQGYEVYQMG